MAVVTPTDRPKSVHNLCVMDVFAGVFVLSYCFLNFSVGVAAFVTVLSQISFLSRERIASIITNLITSAVSYRWYIIFFKFSKIFFSFSEYKLIIKIHLCFSIGPKITNW